MANPTPRTIIDEANAELIDQIDDSTWLGWIADALDELSEIAGAETEVTVTIPAGSQSVAMPAGVLYEDIPILVFDPDGELVEPLPVNGLTAPDGSKVPGYWIRAGKFYYSGVVVADTMFTILCERILEHPADVNTPIDAGLPERFCKRLLKLYGKKASRQAVKDIGTKQDYQDDYDLIRAQLLKTTTRKRLDRRASTFRVE